MSIHNKVVTTVWGGTITRCMRHKLFTLDGVFFRNNGFSRNQSRDSNSIVRVTRYNFKRNIGFNNRRNNSRFVIINRMSNPRLAGCRGMEVPATRRRHTSRRVDTTTRFNSRRDGLKKTGRRRKTGGHFRFAPRIVCFMRRTLRVTRWQWSSTHQKF